MAGTGAAARRKGNDFERWLVRQFKEAGIKAERIGWKDRDDVLVLDEHYEAKNRESIGDYLWEWLRDCKGLFLKKANKEPLVVLRLKDYINLIRTVTP
jgi:hypothetical protein